MSDYEKRTIREHIDREIEHKLTEISRLRDILHKFPKLGELKCTVGVCGSWFDFDNLSHEDVIKVIQAIGGKWDKEPADNKINYTTTIDGMRFRCWRGEPPPSCRIVEEEVLIPAQPERREMRRKLVCVEEQPAPTTTEDGGLGVKYYPVAEVRNAPPTTPEAA